MQIICLILLFFLFPGSLSGGAVNLLQEWEKPAAVTPYLPQWRFGNWGKGQNSRKIPASLHKVQL